MECGRDGECLAAREVWNESECDVDELAAIEVEMAQADLEGRQWSGSSYMTSEIVGIGGKVKKKLKKRVLVGAIVKEYEDERVQGTFLAREQTGANRSWCNWCARVVLGKKDLEAPARRTTSMTSASSAEV